jgi:ferredoxin
VRQGKLCIEVTPTSKIAFLSEELCIGCGICVKKCPFEAINIINLPKSLEGSQTHRYGPNSFKLHRLPMPRPGQVLGLVGQNGTGKSTALKILAGKLKPNLGRFDNPPDWTEVLAYFRWEGGREGGKEGENVCFAGVARVGGSVFVVLPPCLFAQGHMVLWLQWLERFCLLLPSLEMRWL